MIAPELVQVLCCPETHQPVREADPGTIGNLNAQISRGALRNRAGQLIEGPIESGLLRADGQVLYPIRRGIPVMLVDEGILVAAAD